ncbi:DUF742 domain-containing protein [Saccharopolyspora gloriosae]|uniref:DUF742 domain-containing protein n=1 Tax=Saccharopolyspora gloriosae TaxID=455344 RepID=UPI001FB68D3F|nr:DUF742 domain-containing protein [Saccharopolyspora gloriosae]
MSESEFGEQDRRRDEPDANTFADVMNGFTFDSGRGRRGRKKKGDPVEESAAEQDAGQQGDAGASLPPPGYPQARRPTARPPADAFDRRDPFDSPDLEWETQAPSYRDPDEGWGDHADFDSRAGDPAPWNAGGTTAGRPDWGGGNPVSGQSRGAFDAPGGPEPEPSGEVPAAIRSYTWTGGRTRSNYELQMETLVSTSETFRSGSAGRMEHESIAELCRHPRSVAEVGALLSVPIGVARVLLADMAELGMVTVHQTVTESGSAPHLLLMERVLSGLRRL